MKSKERFMSVMVNPLWVQLQWSEACQYRFGDTWLSFGWEGFHRSIYGIWCEPARCQKASMFITDVLYQRTTKYQMMHNHLIRSAQITTQFCSSLRTLGLRWPISTPECGSLTWIAYAWNIVGQSWESEKKALGTLMPLKFHKPTIKCGQAHCTRS